MKILVLGATGKTGGQAAERALRRGQSVTVLVRDAARFTKPGLVPGAGETGHAITWADLAEFLVEEVETDVGRAVTVVNS